MSLELQESPNAIASRFLQAISEVDCATLQNLVTAKISLMVPGARDVDITQESAGRPALCEWAQTVHEQCGKTVFKLHRYFENGCELMAVGAIEIVRLPRTFKSPCSIHVRFEGGLIAAFQLLLDTYALEKFRGEMD